MPSTIWSGTTQFTVTSGEETVVPLRVPHRAIIRGYNMVQLDGAPDGFSADVYTSNQETEPNASLPEEAFYLFNIPDEGEVIADPDVVAMYASNNVNIAYVNRDGTPSNPQRYLYLRITPNGTPESEPGGKTFSLTLTIETPVLR